MVNIIDFSEIMNFFDRLLWEESDPEGISLRNALRGDFHYPEKIQPIERLALDLKRRPKPFIAKYAEIAEAMTRHPLVLNAIANEVEKPEPGESLEAYSTRKCKDAEKRIRERKIQSYEAELKEAIKVRDLPKIKGIFDGLEALSSPLPPEIYQLFYSGLGPDSFGCKMGPKPKEKPSRSREKRILFYVYKYLCENKKAVQWIFNAEKQAFSITENSNLLNDKGEFDPQWRFPELERNRGDNLPENKKKRGLSLYLLRHLKQGVCRCQGQGK